MNQDIDEAIKEDVKQNDDTQFKIIKQHFRLQFKQSYKYVGNIIFLSFFQKGFYLLFSFAKYLACFYTLQQRDSTCNLNPLFVWLTIVGMYEFLNSIRYLTILYSLQMNSKDIFLLVLGHLVMQDQNELTQIRGLNQLNRRAQIKELIKMKINKIPPIEQEPFTLWEIIHQAEALNKYTRVMKVYNQFVFYLLFTCGNIAYISSDSNDCDEHLNNVTFLLLLVGYLFSAFLIVGFGLAILSMGLYLPVILFLFVFKSIGNLIKKIQTNKKFAGFITYIYVDVQDHSQCNICMLEYVNGDKILELPCNKKHHFHEECLKQWLIIKQQCPVCRKHI